MKRLVLSLLCGLCVPCLTHAVVTSTGLFVSDVDFTTIDNQIVEVRDTFTTDGTEIFIDWWYFMDQCNGSGQGIGEIISFNYAMFPSAYPACNGLGNTDLFPVGGGQIVVILEVEIFTAGTSVDSVLFRQMRYFNPDASSGLFQDYSTIPNAPLPIELVAFTGSHLGNGIVALKWRTASEQESDYFEVQRSVNGTEWTTVGTVDAGGTTNVPHSYSITDKVGASDTYLFRLKERAYSSRVTYSPVVSVIVELGATVELFPNPAATLLHIVSDTSVRVRLMNTTGHVIYQSDMLCNECEVDVSSMPPGIYFVVIEDILGTLLEVSRVSVGR